MSEKRIVALFWSLFAFAVTWATFDYHTAAVAFLWLVAAVSFMRLVAAERRIVSMEMVAPPEHSVSGSLDSPASPDNPETESRSE